MREQLESGDRLRLSTPNGAISIRQGSGSEVEIRAAKTADRGASMSHIGFIVQKSADGLVVCAAYNDDDECDMDRGCRQRRNRSRDGWNRQRARASFVVTIPAGVRMNAGTDNGDIEIRKARRQPAGTGNACGSRNKNRNGLTQRELKGAEAQRTAGRRGEIHCNWRGCSSFKAVEFFAPWCLSDIVTFMPLQFHLGCRPNARWDETLWRQTVSAPDCAT